MRLKGERRFSTVRMISGLTCHFSGGEYWTRYYRAPRSLISHSSAHTCSTVDTHRWAEFHPLASPTASRSRFLGCKIIILTNYTAVSAVEAHQLSINSLAGVVFYLTPLSFTRNWNFSRSLLFTRRNFSSIIHNAQIYEKNIQHIHAIYIKNIGLTSKVFEQGTSESLWASNSNRWI